MRIVVVGGGMQGRVIASNLRARPEMSEVVIADLNEPVRLPNGVTYERLDVLDKNQARAAAGVSDAVVLAVPSSIAHAALENLIKAGKPIVDVSFTPDPPLDLHAAAIASGACCVIDCGIAPGFSHLLVGSAHAALGGLDSVRIWVGGMPQEPPPVFRHAVYFNPHDLIAEYVRPARARQDGRGIAPAPMDLPFVDFVDSELGQLEAFGSDGLRTLLTSYPHVPHMAEYTLRWPGHLDTMKSLGAMGLLDDPACAHGLAISLAKRYPDSDYPDVLLMLVEAQKGNERRSWRLIDRRTDGVSAMSRTTGYTTAAIAMVLARRQFTEPGVHPPERLGSEPMLVDEIVKDLAQHGVIASDTSRLSAQDGMALPGIGATG